MSKPCLPEVKSTGASKMGNISGSPKNYEHPSNKAERLCSGGNAYAEGGSVAAQNLVNLMAANGATSDRGQASRQGIKPLPINPAPTKAFPDAGR